MPNQEIQHHNTHDSRPQHLQSEASKTHTQKLFENAYSGVGHSAEAHPKSDEQLKTEYVEARIASFKKQDTNHDGKISVEEAVKANRAEVASSMHQYTTAISKSEMASLDLNHNGNVTLKEYEKAKSSTHESVKQLAAEFKSLDANGDGHLSFSEIKDFNTARNAQIDKSIMKAIDGAVKRAFQTMDANHDGKLSLAEYIAPAISMPTIWSSGATTTGAGTDASGDARPAPAEASPTPAPPPGGAVSPSTSRSPGGGPTPTSIETKIPHHKQ